MTDQDNLRDRIADLLWRTEEKTWEDQAQAIIDEFGLTVESVSEKAVGHMVRHAQSRVVGKWEKQ